MIVLSETGPQLPPAGSARDIEASTAAARLAQCEVYTIPPDFDRCGDAEGALAHVPARKLAAGGIWIGFIPSPSRYASIHAVAARRNILLLNSLEEHLNAQEFDRAYSRLGESTPASRCATNVAAAREAATAIGYPVFVKGSVRRAKAGVGALAWRNPRIS